MNDGKCPAFPVVSKRCGKYSGMSLRDYFAAKAMQGITSLESTNDYLAKNYGEGIELLAISSYRIADAMLRAREEE